MNKNAKKILIKIIKETKQQNKEQQFYFITICLKAYIRSIITFGKNNIVQKEIIKIYKEIKQIINEEEKIYNFIEKNALNIDEESTYDFLDELDELNEKTIEYYCKLLEDIFAAFDLKNEIYAKRIKKDFETLIENNIYKEKAACLLISLQDLKQTLGFDEEFWEYLEERITFANIYDKINFEIHSILNDKNEVIDFKVILPYITNYESKEKCMELLIKSYQLYLQISKNNKSNNDIKMSSERIKKYIINRFNK